MCRAENGLQGPALKALRMKDQIAGEDVKRAERGGKAGIGTSRSRKGEESATEPIRTNRGFLAGIGWNQRAGRNSTGY